MIWFTSDFHIGHDKEFLWKDRGFPHIYAHDEAIIKNINEVVEWNDELWILGDLALGIDEREWDRVFYNLRCKNIYFIIGNHDTDRKIDKYINEYNLELKGYATMIKGSKKKRFYLSHYPTITDNFDDTIRSHTINLYGHTHQKTNFFNNNPYMYHVGLDSHNMYPVSIEQIIKDIDKKVREKENEN